MTSGDRAFVRGRIYRGKMNGKTELTLISEVGENHYVSMEDGEGDWFKYFKKITK
jgi:hypothetical protein